MRLPTSNTRKIKKMILATAAAPAAMSVNPNIAAITAITKKIAVHFNITFGFWFLQGYLQTWFHARQHPVSPGQRFSREKKPQSGYKKTIRTFALYARFYILIFLISWLLFI